MTNGDALIGLLCDTYIDLQTTRAQVKQLAQHVTNRDTQHQADQARIAELEAQLAGPATEAGAAA